MRFIGQLGRSFGNFLTLRGIAKMGNLDGISKPDPAYQRALNTDHRRAMINFLKKGEYTFYPELILSLTLDRRGGPQENSGSIQEKINQIYENSSQKTQTISIDRVKLQSRTYAVKSQSDTRMPELFTRGILEIDQGLGKILNRIDGNHRLSVTEEANKKEEPVPFCIIFLRNHEEAEKFNRVLFNNINYKSLPLTPEENLRLIFEKKENGKYIFPDHELEDPVWFGKEYIRARNWYSNLNLSNLDTIVSILKEGKKDIWTRTMLFKFSETLNNKVPDTGPKKALQATDSDLRKALQATEECYRRYPPLKPDKKPSYHLIIVHLHYYFEEKLPIFFKWVKDNHIYELKKVDAEGLINLFDKVVEAKRRTIFLAMPFDKKADQNKDAVENAVDRINEIYKLDLKLKLIRIDATKTGYSFAITDEILNNIEEGGYLIADITLANPNVYYELGYQMGLNTGKGLGQNNFLVIHNKSVNGANFYKDKNFNISNLSIETAEDSNSLRRKVEEQVKRYYGLENA